MSNSVSGRGRPAAENLKHRCIGTNQAGERCRQAAYPFTTVCYYHGGRGVEPSRVANTIHGRRSRSVKHVPTLLKDRYEEHLSDPDLLKVETDIAFARAVLEQYLSNFEHAHTLTDEQAESLLAKTERVVGLVDKHLAAQDRNSAKLTEGKATVWIAQVAAAMYSALLRHVPDPEQRAACIAEVRASVGNLTLGSVRPGLPAPGIADRAGGRSFGSMDTDEG